MDYSLLARPNFLRLYGGPYNLSIPTSPTLFLRKQMHRFCTWETRLSFHPTSEYAEAGTVVWWNYFTYSSIGLRINEKTRFIRFQPAEGAVVERELRSNRSDVVFLIECGDRYKFGFREIDGTAASMESQWIGEVSNGVMTKEPPIGISFTGMMLGIYSFAERQRCLAPADFHYVEFR